MQHSSPANGEEGVGDAVEKHGEVVSQLGSHCQSWAA